MSLIDLQSARMLDQIGGALSAAGGLSEPLGWLVLALFLVGVALEYYDREYARIALVGAWGLFALFWLTLIYPWFAIDHSAIRGVGATLAVPLSLLVAKTLYEGRDSLFTLSRAIAVMGLVYAPFVMIMPLREQLVLIVTDQTKWAMSLVGHNPPLVTELSEVGVDREIQGKENAFENTFVFFRDGGGTITYSIIIACTGLGSMAVMIGLISAVRAPVRRKLRALAIAVPIIYALNLVRNVMIAVTFGNQYMHVFPDLTMTVFGLDNDLMVSYIWIDRIIAQSLSVVAMVLIFWLVLRELPEVIQPVEDVLYLLTGTEYDLAGALDLDVDGNRPEPAD
jgi:archaeosortase A (PGF-CTERM-specific)